MLACLLFNFPVSCVCWLLLCWNWYSVTIASYNLAFLSVMVHFLVLQINCIRVSCLWDLLLLYIHLFVVCMSCYMHAELPLYVLILVSNCGFWRKPLKILMVIMLPLLSVSILYWYIVAFWLPFVSRFVIITDLMLWKLKNFNLAMLKLLIGSSVFSLSWCIISAAFCFSLFPLLFACQGSAHLLKWFWGMNYSLSTWNSPAFSHTFSFSLVFNIWIS